MNKVKIRILEAVNIGQPETSDPYVAVPGDEVEVSQATAQLIVGSGRAEHVKGKLYEDALEPEEPPVETATAEPEATATAEPQRSGTQRRRG